MGVLALGVVDLAAVAAGARLLLRGGHPADRVLLRLLAVVGAATARVLDLRLLSAALVSHGKSPHFRVGAVARFSHPTSVDVKLKAMIHFFIKYVNSHCAV